MGCTTGCGNGEGALPKGCNNNGSCGSGAGCNKLTVFDWLANMNLPDGQSAFQVLEVRFKNSRKEFYRNTNNLPLSVGEVVAVEAASGHDIGTVSLTGELVKLQLKKHGIGFDSDDVKKIYRKAKQNDIEKWREAQSLEINTMYKARTIALRLGLEMKLSDVEYQGDKSKAVFYYTAEARVDFRELIKVLASEFGVRIEMRQIGARQEASRLGGIGACGRELCCSSWLTDFRTVSTSAARYQQLSLNPLKLAGQCGKLKCCLNFELDNYLDVLKEFPEMDGKRLQTQKGDAFLQKTDIFKRLMYFSYRNEPEVFIPLKISEVKKVMEANARGEKPDDFKVTFVETAKVKPVEHNFENVVGQDSLTRFDKGQHTKQGNKKGPVKNNQNKKPVANNQKQQSQNKLNHLKTANKPNGNSNQKNNNNRKPHHNRNKNNKPNNDASKTKPTE